MNSTISKYRENQITSATPEKSVLMLYDGAIGFLRSAIKEFEENNNIAEKSILVEKTVKIIDYLQSCIDEERGGEIGKNLNMLYNYMVLELTKANLKNDIQKMGEILDLLRTIRDGWNGICDKSNGKKDQPAAYKDGGVDREEGFQPERKIGIKI
jgi:flagellar protein FliS